MNFRNKRRVRVTAMLLALLTSACSSDGSTERAVSVLSQVVVAPFRSAAPIQAPVDRAYIVIAYGGGRTPMALASESNGIARYEGPGGVRMVLNNGILAQLRGLGQEFEALYPVEGGPYRDNLLNLSRLPEPVIRTVEYWIEQNPRRDRFSCKFARTGTNTGLQNIVETCQSLYSDLSFANRYWVDDLGRIVLSQQWFHPKALLVEIDHRRLNPQRK